MWRIEGAERYYDNSEQIKIPQTIVDATAKERVDVKELLEEFVREHLKPTAGEGANINWSVSTQEIREVYFGGWKSTTST